MTFPELKQLIACSIIALDNFEEWLGCIPELNSLVTTQQDPLHHAEGNVWIHTQMVLRALVAQAEFARATEDQHFILFITA